MAYGIATFAGMPACRGPIASSRCRRRTGTCPGVHAARSAAAGEHPMAGREVIAIVVMHRANDAELVGHLGMQREEFGHLACRARSVLIGRQRPRYSGGASGFMSYVSMCPGPPSIQSKMTDVSFFAHRRGRRFFHPQKAATRPRLPMPARPSCTKLRREIAIAVFVRWCQHQFATWVAFRPLVGPFLGESNACKVRWDRRHHVQ